MKYPKLILLSELSGETEPSTTILNPSRLRGSKINFPPFPNPLPVRKQAIETNKTHKYMRLRHTFALIAILTGNALASTSAPLPEFMNENQLATWREEMAEQSASKDKAQAKADAAAADQSFYTGKPYLPATGSYAFKYRSYQPELARWTSEDPSGFPDGANANIYAPTPTSEFDWMGLESENINLNFAYVFPLTNGVVTGKWEGAFVWTFAHGEERAGTKIVDSPGFSGFTGIPLTIEVAGVTIGVAAYHKASLIDRSSFITEMRDGVQWRKWIVDLEVKFTEELTLLAPVKSIDMGSRKIYKIGEWYE